MTEAKTEEKFDMNDYQAKLDQISRMNHVGGRFEDYGRFRQGKLKGKHTNLEFLVEDPKTGNLGLGSIINPDDPKMFLNETDTAIEDMVINYQERNRPRIQSYLAEYGPRIVSDYTSVHNKRIEKIIEFVKKGMDEKKVPEDKRAAILDSEILPQLQKIVGDQLASLTPNENYMESKDADPEVVEVLKELSELKNLSDEETKDVASGIMIKKHGLSDNYKNFRRDWSGIRDGMIDMRSRHLAKKALVKTEKGYEIDKEFVAKVFGGYDGLLEMSPVAQSLYKQKE